MKYKYKIENLDCANCAKEIENHLNKDPNLKNVSCNFSKSTLTYFLTFLVKVVSIVRVDLLKLQDTFFNCWLILDLVISFI